MTHNLPYFISYRRTTDKAAAKALFDELGPKLGADKIFYDVGDDVIPAGIRWPERLLASVAGCKVMLAVIGPGWVAELEQRNKGADGAWGPISQSRDWVRKEQAVALALGKPFIPVMVGGARVPRKTALPVDLELLPEMQPVHLPDAGDARAAALDALVVRLAGELQKPTTIPAWRLGTDPDLPPDEDDLESSYGQRWGELTETATPHSYDYKFSILDEEKRQQVRIMLLAANETGELSHPFTLAFLKALGEPRKFAHSENKRGMFLQASCVVTDGMTDGVVRHVLLAVREKYQIHDRLDPRNVAGESCVVGTCLTSFRNHDEDGHLPSALLVSLTNPNPWALFSRKLLFPDPLVDCRFLGVGFNFRNAGGKKPRPDLEREYVHLIWHVRTRNRPPLMLVPARHAKNFDAPVWQSVEQVAEFDFEKAPIDRLVLEKALGVKFADGRRGATSPLIGFVTCRAFEHTHLNANRPARWFRDTVVLDLLRAYQQHVHRPERRDPGNPDVVVQSPRRPPTDTAANLLRDVHAFLGEMIEELRRQDATPTPRTRLEAVVLPDTAGEGALLVRLRDEEQNAVYTFLVVATLGDDETPTTDIGERYERRLHDGFAGVNPAEEPKALFVLQGVRSDMKYRLQRPVTITDRSVPIHVVRVALLAPTAGARPPKRVAHALVPIRRGGTVDALLFTRSSDDELPRLPGGKIEGDETPAQAAARELEEELDLPAGEIEEAVPVGPGSFGAEEISPSSGELTRYEFYPFVVRLDARGAARVRALLGAARECRVAPVAVAKWRATGLGFDPAYAQAVLDQITPDLLDSAAVTVD